MIKILLRLTLLLALFSLPPSRLGQAVEAQPQWKRLESKNFIVFYENTSEGRKILREAKAAYPRITSEFNYYPLAKTSIYVYHSHSLFLAKSPAGITRAYSQPFMSKVFISATQKSIEPAVAHEITHIVFLQSLPDPSTVPFWFVEGIAVYESEPNQESADIEAYALQGKAHSIFDLSKENPEGREEEQKVAAEGYVIVNFIVDEYGRDGLSRLIQNLQKGFGFSIALRKSLGASEGEIDRAWYKYASVHSRRVYIQNLRYLGFLILGLLVVVASGVWIGKRRRELRELEEEEAEESLDQEDMPV